MEAEKGSRVGSQRHIQPAHLASWRRFAAPVGERGDMAFAMGKAAASKQCHCSLTVLLALWLERESR